MTHKAFVEDFTGGAEELLDAADEVNKVNAELSEILGSRIPESDNWLQETRHFSVGTALALGLVDDVLPARIAARAPGLKMVASVVMSRKFAEQCKSCDDDEEEKRRKRMGNDNQKVLDDVIQDIETESEPRKNRLKSVLDGLGERVKSRAASTKDPVLKSLIKSYDEGIIPVEAVIYAMLDAEPAYTVTNVERHRTADTRITPAECGHKLNYKPNLRRML
jgi:hypothetical protein